MLYYEGRILAGLLFQRSLRDLSFNGSCAPLVSTQPAAASFKFQRELRSLVSSQPSAASFKMQVVAACNYSGGCKAMCRTLLEGVWLCDIGRMAEVRNVPHLACKV